MTLTEQALARRLKRHLLKEPQGFFAACAPGFEDVLLGEVAALPGVAEVAGDTGGVSFVGPLDTAYHANLQLRSAHRVLLRVDEGLTQSYPALFGRVRRVPWELYLGFGDRYGVRVSARESRLRHERNIVRTVADGVQAALEPHGLAPGLSDDADLELHLRLFQDRCTLSVNTSGAHLHKRGYRALTGDAPIRETLAASVLLASSAQEHDLILDPMCGSGTLLVEAALLATHTPPGLARTFAFEAAPYFQASKWARFKAEAAAAQRPAGVRLLGSDTDTRALELARANAEAAGVAEHVNFERADATRLEPPSAARGLLVSNLPYGARLGTPQEADRLLAAFGAQLRARFEGWDYAFVTRDPGWLRRAGLEPDELRPFRNGGLRVLLARGRIAPAA